MKISMEGEVIQYFGAPTLDFRVQGSFAYVDDAIYFIGIPHTGYFRMDTNYEIQNFYRSI